MQKKVLVIFGGMSTEHDVSRISVTSILNNIDKDKYYVEAIGIDKQGKWFKYIGEYDNIKLDNWLEYTQIINNVLDFISSFDVVFPVLHGLYGEDGTIQGMLEMLKVPYVGCKVLSSSVSMDKAYTKILFDRAGLPQLPYEYLYVRNGNVKLITKEFDEIHDTDRVLAHIEKTVGYPCFVKPSNSGSSVGIKKARNKEDLWNHIMYASKYDKKIVVEKGIECREIECAVLEQNEEILTSALGEVLPAGDFYTYDSKYNDAKSGTAIPADLSTEVVENIKEMAKKAFNTVDGKGLSRVDFFIDKNTNNVYINEINTMPGFTNISMYPKLWEYSGLDYTTLITKLIDNELDR